MATDRCTLRGSYSCPHCGEELTYIEPDQDPSEFWGVVKVIIIKEAWYCDGCEVDIPKGERV